MYKVLSTKRESGTGDFGPGMGHVVFGIWGLVYI